MVSVKARLDERGQLRLAVQVGDEERARQLRSLGAELKDMVQTTVEVFGPSGVSEPLAGPAAGCDPSLDPVDRDVLADSIVRLFPSSLGRFRFVAGRNRPCSWRKTKLPESESCYGMSYAHLVDPTAEHLADFSRTLCLCPPHARLARRLAEKGRVDEAPIVAAHVGGQQSELPDAGWARVANDFATGRLRRLPQSFWDDLFDRNASGDGGWPSEIEGLGVRNVHPLSRCARCGSDAQPSAAATFVWYGETPICKRHAVALGRGEQPETHVDPPEPAGNLEDYFDGPA